jgi:hypothetical protein
MIHTLIHPRTAELSLTLPPEYVDQDLEVIVFARGESHLAQPSPLPAKRSPGALKGKIKMNDDFAAPLADFQDYQ